MRAVGRHAAILLRLLRTRTPRTLRATTFPPPSPLTPSTRPPTRPFERPRHHAPTTPAGPSKPLPHGPDHPRPASNPRSPRSRPPTTAVTANPPALQAIIDEATKVDAVHDALARAVHNGIAAERTYALAERPPAVERAKQAEQALTNLFPQGLAIVNASLLAESGNTARVATLLQQAPKLSDFLAAIPVQGAGALLTVAQRWITAGKKLAKLEDDREDLEAKHATQPLTREATIRLRARWMRLVAQILSLLEISDAAPEAIAKIRRPIEKASARAGNRYGEPADVTSEMDLEEDDDDTANEADDREPIAATGTGN